MNSIPVEAELKRFKNSSSALALYIEGKNKLVQSGIVNFLRIFARPCTVDGGSNVYASAYRAAFTEGYNHALDDIVYFEEIHLIEQVGKKPLTADFGGLALAIKKGDLTEKDISGKR